MKNGQYCYIKTTHARDKTIAVCFGSNASKLMFEEHTHGTLHNQILISLKLLAVFRHRAPHESSTSATSYGRQKSIAKMGSFEQQSLTKPIAWAWRSNTSVRVG